MSIRLPAHIFASRYESHMAPAISFKLAPSSIIVQPRSFCVSFTYFTEDAHWLVRICGSFFFWLSRFCKFTSVSGFRWRSRGFSNLDAENLRLQLLWHLTRLARYCSALYSSKLTSKVLKSLELLTLSRTIGRIFHVTITFLCTNYTRIPILCWSIMLLSTTTSTCRTTSN